MYILIHTLMAGMTCFKQIIAWLLEVLAEKGLLAGLITSNGVLMEIYFPQLWFYNESQRSHFPSNLTKE